MQRARQGLVKRKSDKIQPQIKEIKCKFNQNLYELGILGLGGPRVLGKFQLFSKGGVTLTPEEF